MIDREKVILGLEKCTEHGFNCGVKGKGCPYYDWKYNDAETGDCIDRLMLDALDLLKEDEKRIANYRRWHENQKNTIKELLKAQEPRVLTDSDFADNSNIDSQGLLPAWIEYRRDTDEWAEYWEEDADEWTSVRITNYKGEGYRCWTSKPTDEQRRATPWLT